MRAFFGNTLTMLIVATMLLSIGLALGIWLRDFTWFARFGSLVVAIGITLLSRASVIQEDIISHALQIETGLSHLDTAHYEQIGSAVPEWVHEDRRTRAAVGIWGPLVSFIGTLVWGFGDLLNRFW
jgi:hypothetical protein